MEKYITNGIINEINIIKTNRETIDKLLSLLEVRPERLDDIYIALTMGLYLKSMGIISFLKIFYQNVGPSETIDKYVYEKLI